MRNALPYIPPVAGQVVPRYPGTHTFDGEPARIINFRGEPDPPKWEGRCKVDFSRAASAVRLATGALEGLALSMASLNRRTEEVGLAVHRIARYSGENVRLGDYYVREVERTGTEHRQVVHYEVVGTGRIERMPRSRFDRQVRAA